MTDLDRVRQYIESKGQVKTWDFEEFVRELPPEYKMTAESAARHARTLASKKLIKHPIKMGIIDRHTWEWVGELESNYTFDQSGQRLWC